LCVGNPIILYCLGVEVKDNLNTLSSINPVMYLLRIEPWWSSNFKTNNAL